MSSSSLLTPQAFPGFQDPCRPGTHSDTRPTEIKLREELLTCSTCKKQFDFGKRNPHMLPCGDTSCQDCLRQFAGRGGKAMSMYCPVCDRTLTVPGGHICCFPNDENTLTILEVYKLVEAFKKDFVPCIGCELNGNARCLECKENYCEDHANFHSITSATKDHTVVKFIDILADPAKILKANGQQLCSKHVESAMEAVCGTCNALICLVCALTDHRGHNIKEIGETVELLKERIEPILDRVDQKHYDSKQNYGMAKDVDKTMNVMFQRTKRDLNIAYMGMIRNVRDRQLDLFGAIDEYNKGNKKILGDQKKAVEDEITFTIRGQDLLKEMYDTFSAAEIGVLGAEVQGLIDECQTIPDNLPTNPLSTLRVSFDAKNEQKYMGQAKNFGKLKVIANVQLSLMPVVPKNVFDDEEEEDEELLPIDDSELLELSKLVEGNVPL